MTSFNEKLFFETYFYKCTVSKHELLKSHNTNPVIQKIRSFKEYGKWQFQFWPDGYSGNPKSYCIRLISTNPKNLGLFFAKISIFISDGSGRWITICKNAIQRVSKIIPAFGIICSTKSFLQDFPETLKWDKIHLEIKCSFTEIEDCLINEQNWITFKFLQRHNYEAAVNVFASVDSKTKELNYFDVDAVIICKNKWYMFWKPKEVSIPIHKTKIALQSNIFAEILSTTNSITIPSDFSFSTVEKAILFCYQGYLKSYEKRVIKFATKYQMTKLLLKANKNLELKESKEIDETESEALLLPENFNEKFTNKKLRRNNVLVKIITEFFGFIKALV